MIDLSLAPCQKAERYRPDTAPSDPAEAFRATIANHGLVVDHIDTSGSLVRVDIDKPGDKAGWYVFHLGEVSAGAFGNWRTDLNEKWCSKDRREMSDAESAEYARFAATSKAQREALKVELHAAARAKAIEIWESAQETIGHEYLTKKGVPSHGLKQSRGALVVPLRDEKGELHNLQFIKVDGEKKKRFLFGGRIEGLSFIIPGSNEFAVCEGYATGATVHQATGATVVCAMNRVNLLPVAKVLRAACPHAQVTIFADNDRFTPGNPGLADATKAAKSISAKLVFPVFDGLPGADDAELKLTDFNDLAATGGLDLVRQQIAQPMQKGRLLPLTAASSIVAGRLRARPAPLDFIFRFNEQGLIPRGVVGVLTATGGTGKTFFLLSMAMAGASGGNFGPINAPKPLTTLVIVGEDSQDELDRRLWDIGRGKFPDKLHAASVYGEIGPLMRMEGANPVLADAWYWLDDTIANHPGLDLLILDPKSRFYGLNENDSEHATQWIQCLETLSKKYGVTILFSHHTSKDTAGVISQNMSRGSSAIVDGCRWQAGLVRMDAKTAERFCIDNPRDYVLFDAPKSNYAADLPAAICFKRGECGVLEYCEPGCEIRNEMAEALLEMLTNDTTKYSRRDLIDQVTGRDVARDMKAKFPGFVRSKDMKNTIDHLMKTKRLFEVASGTDGAGKPKMVLSASPF